MALGTECTTNHFELYAQQQQMENGFTERDSKGLFTFYRQQNQLQNRKHKLHLTSIQASNPIKKHYVSLSNYNHPPHPQKPPEQTSKSKPQSQRYNQVRQQHQVKSTFTPKNVLTINFRNSRKNQFYFQLISNKSKRNRTEIQSYFKQKIPTRIKQTNLLKNLSVREIPANQVKDMFKPKKQCFSKYQNIRRNPLKMNAISAHCLSDNHRSFQDEKIFHMPILKPPQTNKTKQQISTMLKEVLQLRRHRLQSSTFWQQIKQRKPKRQVAIVNLNSKIQEWTRLQSLKTSSGLLIHQLLKQ